MMSIIGWLFCIAFMLYMSAAATLGSFNNLGKYNIGGVSNTFGDRLFALVFDVVVLCGWYAVFIYSPFTLSMK